MGNSALDTLNNLIADFAGGVASPAASADTLKLSAVLQHVGQQRVQIDNTLNRLQASASYAQTESAQVQASQTTLIQADLASIATQLSTAKSQHGSHPRHGSVGQGLALRLP